MSLEEREREKRLPCEDGGRDWSNVATSQGMSGPPEAEKGRNGVSPKPTVRISALQTLDFRPIPARTVRDYSVVLGGLWYLVPAALETIQALTGPDLQMLVGPRARALDLHSSLSTLSPSVISSKDMALEAFYNLRTPECVVQP